MLIDTTLREGAQLFGAYFSVETKLAIVTGLLDTGIEEIELGWVGQDRLAEFIGRVRPLAGKTKLSVWSPCREEDIRAAASLDVDRVNIGVPASDVHIEGRLGLSREGLLERLTRTLFLAKLLGITYVSVGLEDVSRAEEGFALSLGRTAQDMGANRVRLSDSLGLWTPHDGIHLVGRFRERLSIDLAVHCHDDFGMGTANAISALQCGAQYADVSVLGIGERSGIAATEELVAYYAFKERVHAYTTEGLRALCNLVSRASNIQIPRTKSVAGEDIFSCESGLHAHALSKSPTLFEPYDPARIGVHRRIAVGGKSGRAAVASALSSNGLAYEEQELPGLVAAVKDLSQSLKRPLTASELATLVKPQ